ncbi:hypothetical protein GALL_367560 [mine drainage metagenome]|uniref:Uncharacterized protein n=1 Tax=mine drainage metagenome TaxID=410659 RepID=A0A1J5QDE6_9ZZZZ
MTANAFFGFLDTCKAAFRRIVRACRGERTEEDMPGEAWIAAEAIAKQRQQPVDFADPSDRELVLSWLYNRLVRFQEKTQRYAARLDVGWDDDAAEQTGPVALARVLAAPDLFDPALQLPAIEEREQRLAWTAASYSEASAYGVLLDRFDWDARELAGHLLIVVGTLRRRLLRASTVVKRQPSLFDGVECIARDFVPTVRARRC